MRKGSREGEEMGTVRRRERRNSVGKGVWGI